ncbi:MAG: hypothetical protein QOF52_1193 [Propionibacteriaceae bacterium]|jgi:hypothetical protein|nr:nucleotidyltransferase protein [Propionibacteriaceae bacterium]MDX6321335.1 hypothetical protein [Propionibacteriaceae bacterium]
MHHHEQTFAAFTESQRASSDTLGVLVVGSVARGDERPDSDVDVYLVVTDSAYDVAARAGRVGYVSTVGVAYLGGYVDVKLASPGYLRAAADRGDRFLLQHSAVHSALAAGRCALAHHRRLFRGQKYLAADLTGLAPALPDGFLDAWSDIIDQPSPERAGDLIDVVDRWLADPLTGDEALSAFIAANELGWHNHTIPPEYW